MRKYREPKVTRTFKTTSFIGITAELDEATGTLVQGETPFSFVGEFTAEQCKAMSGAFAVKDIKVTEQLYGMTASEFLAVAKPITTEE